MHLTYSINTSHILPSEYQLSNIQLKAILEYAPKQNEELEIGVEGTLPSLTNVLQLVNGWI